MGLAPLVIALGAVLTSLETARMVVAESLPQIKPLFIGSLKVDPPILQAPMAGYTNYAFRQIVRDYGGAGLLATEMVSARGLVWMDQNEAEHPERLWGVKEESRRQGPRRSRFMDASPPTTSKGRPIGTG